MSAAEQKAKKFFKTCMDAESPEIVGSEPFLTLLQQVHILCRIRESKKEKSTLMLHHVFLYFILSLRNSLSLSVCVCVCVVRWLGSIR